MTRWHAPAVSLNLPIAADLRVPVGHQFQCQVLRRGLGRPFLERFWAKRVQRIVSMELSGRGAGAIVGMLNDEGSERRRRWRWRTPLRMLCTEASRA